MVSGISRSNRGAGWYPAEALCARCHASVQDDLKEKVVHAPAKAGSVESCGTGSHVQRRTPVRTSKARTSPKRARAR